MSNVSRKFLVSFGATLLMSLSAKALPPCPAIYLLVEKPTWNQDFFRTLTDSINHIKYAAVPITVKFKFGYLGGTPNTVVSLDVLGKLLCNSTDTGTRLVTTSASDYPILLDNNGFGETQWFPLNKTVNLSAVTTHYAGASATAKIYGSSDTPVSEITPTWTGPGAPNPNAYNTPFKVKDP